MESVATGRRAVLLPGSLRRIDVGAVGVWALVGGLVLYLGVEGGGYDIVVRSQVSIVAWWLVLGGAACGLLPVARPSRTAWVAITLFGGFVGWTAVATTWSLSSQDSLAELSRVAGYLGVLILAMAIHRDRDHAVRHTINALAAGIVLIACLALASRLRPGLFPAAQQTAHFLPGDRGRLGWPLNYWNALGALIAIGLPLLLSIATSARTLRAQAAAAAAIPLLLLCGYLTFSRGAAIASAVAVLVFLALAPERIPKLATLLLTGGGGAALIAGAVHRSAIEHGLVSAAAKHQGSTLFVAIVLVCLGVAITQAGIGLAVRHGTPPRPLQVPRDRARMILAGSVATAILVALLAGAPGRISHAWTNFKKPQAAVLQQDAISRFGSTSGNQRYDYWKVAVNATSGSRVLGGSGPGTFQLLWLPNAPYESYVVNAHSLYVETFAETGLIGLALLIGFIALVIGSAVRIVARTRTQARVRAAALAAALVAFAVSASFDWIWQVPVLPVAFLALAAASLAPHRRKGILAGDSEPLDRSWRGSRGRLGVRGGAILLALASVVAIGVPLAITNDLRNSQTSFTAGNTAQALTEARAATRLEPDAAGPQIQAALVLEARRQYTAAASAAQRATSDEPQNWSDWLVRSRIEAEAGHADVALVAFHRAQSLNPHSPIFRQ